MSTLITGASGFVGGRIAEAFVAAGHDIKRTSRDPEKLAKQTFLKMPAPDASDEAFDRLMENVDHVVHCAALNNDAVGATDEEFHLANAVLTRRLAEAASRKAQGRFIYLSSSHAIPAGVAGSGKGRRASAYGLSKGEGEAATLTSFSHPPDRASAVLRLPTVYGVGMRSRLAQLLEIAKLPVPIPMTGLERTHSLVSRDAVADAVLHLVFKSPNLQPIYFASDATDVSIPEIIGAFREGLGRRRLIVRLPGSQALARIMRNRREHTAAENSPSLLVGEGWTPEVRTLERLRELARSTNQTEQSVRDR